MSARWTTALATVAEQLNGNRIEWMLFARSPPSTAARAEDLTRLAISQTAAFAGGTCGWNTTRSSARDSVPARHPRRSQRASARRCRCGWRHRASCDQTHECRGRRADLAEFVHNRATALLRTAYLLNGDQGDAEDLLQSFAARHRPRPVWMRRTCDRHNCRRSHLASGQLA
jgi:hypothetical protein